MVSVDHSGTHRTRHRCHRRRCRSAQVRDRWVKLSTFSSTPSPSVSPFGVLSHRVTGAIAVGVGLRWFATAGQLSTFSSTPSPSVSPFGCACRTRHRCHRRRCRSAQGSRPLAVVDIFIHAVTIGVAVRGAVARVTGAIAVGVGLRWVGDRWAVVGIFIHAVTVGVAVRVLSHASPVPSPSVSVWQDSRPPGSCRWRCSPVAIGITRWRAVAGITGTIAIGVGLAGSLPPAVVGRVVHSVAIGITRWRAVVGITDAVAVGIGLCWIADQRTVIAVVVDTVTVGVPIWCAVARITDAITVSIRLCRVRDCRDSCRRCYPRHHRRCHRSAWESHASPMPSPSVSVCVGLLINGQLSALLSTPSPSVSPFASNHTHRRCHHRQYPFVSGRQSADSCRRCCRCRHRRCHRS